jgi:hypothetical protein
MYSNLSLQVVTEVVVKNAVPWMEKQLQQLEVGS